MYTWNNNIPGMKQNICQRSEHLMWSLFIYVFLYVHLILSNVDNLYSWQEVMFRIINMICRDNIWCLISTKSGHFYQDHPLIISSKIMQKAEHLRLDLKTKIWLFLFLRIMWHYYIFIIIFFWRESCHVFVVVWNIHKIQYDILIIMSGGVSFTHYILHTLLLDNREKKIISLTQQSIVRILGLFH